MKIWTFSFVLLSGCGSHSVVRDDGTQGGKGAAYFLPRTVLVVNVPVVRTDVEPGPHAIYSEVLFGEKAKVTIKKTTFSIGKDPTVEVSGERDPSQRFISIYSKGMTRTATQIYAWNDQGVLTSGKATIENRTAEFVVSGVEAAAKIAVSGIKPVSDAALLYPEVSGLDTLAIHLDSLDNVDKPQLTTRGLRAGLAVVLATRPEAQLDKIMSSDDIDVKQAGSEWVQFTKDRLTGTAELRKIGNIFKDLSEARGQLGGAATADLRTQIQAQVDEILSKFFGKKKEGTWIGQFRWVPPSRDALKTEGVCYSEATLFSIDEQRGILGFSTRPERSPSGIRVGEGDAPRGRTKAVSIQCSAIVPPSTAEWSGLVGDGKKHGWYYRVPAQATIRLKAGPDTLVTKRQDIAQAGHVSFVPSSGSGPKVISDIELDPVTGALKTLTQGSVSFDPALMTRAATAGSSIIEAQAAREKAEASLDDPLYKLKREKEELELRAAIKKLKEE